MNNLTAYLDYLRKEIKEYEELEQRQDEIAEYQASAFSRGRHQALTETLTDLSRYAQANNIPLWEAK